MRPIQSEVDRRMWGADFLEAHLPQGERGRGRREDVAPMEGRGGRRWKRAGKCALAIDLAGFVNSPQLRRDQTEQAIVGANECVTAGQNNDASPLCSNPRIDHPEVDGAIGKIGAGASQGRGAQSNILGFDGVLLTRRGGVGQQFYDAH